MAEGGDPMEALKALLRAQETWHLWVIEYGITHSFMRLALHDGSFPKHHRLECGDCVYLAGPLQGGPYVLEVDVAEEEGRTLIELRSSDRQMRLVCGRMRIVGQVNQPPQ
jgi:hypothetical protein